jgi:hypothetical protein
MLRMGKGLALRCYAEFFYGWVGAGFLTYLLLLLRSIGRGEVRALIRRHPPHLRTKKAPSLLVVRNAYRLVLLFFPFSGAKMKGSHRPVD